MQSALQAKWTELAEKLREESATLPVGRARDHLLERATRLEAAISIEASLVASRQRPSRDAHP